MEYVEKEEGFAINFTEAEEYNLLNEINSVGLPPEKLQKIINNVNLENSSIPGWLRPMIISQISKIGDI